jgi:hypothetical protein
MVASVATTLKSAFYCWPKPSPYFPVVFLRAYPHKPPYTNLSGVYFPKWLTYDKCAWLATYFYFLGLPWQGATNWVAHTTGMRGRIVLDIGVGSRCQSDRAFSGGTRAAFLRPHSWLLAVLDLWYHNSNLHMPVAVLLCIQATIFYQDTVILAEGLP